MNRQTRIEKDFLGEKVVPADAYYGIQTYRALEERCVRGITANPDRCRELVFNSTSIVTAFSPALGYEVSASIAREALESGRSVHDLVLEKGLLSRETIDEILAVENLKHPYYHRA